jgi:hypothetical protein
MSRQPTLLIIVALLLVVVHLVKMEVDRTRLEQRTDQTQANK